MNGRSLMYIARIVSHAYKHVMLVTNALSMNITSVNYINNIDYCSTFVHITGSE